MTDDETVEQHEETQPDIQLELDPEYQQEQEAEDVMQTQTAETPSNSTAKRTRKRRAARVASAKTSKPKPNGKVTAKASRTKTAKKAVAAKTSKRAKFEGPLPKPEDLRLAPNGIKAVPQNRYINIEFLNGYVVRLFPAGVPAKDVPKVRDLLVSWLNKRLAG